MSAGTLEQGSKDFTGAGRASGASISGWAPLGADICIVVASVVVVAIGHGESIREPRLAPNLLIILATTICALTATGYLVGLYPARYAWGSYEESRSLVASWAASLLVVLFVDRELPMAVEAKDILQTAAVGTALILTARWTSRAVHERARRPVGARHRAVVYGAGEAGEQLVRSLLRHRDSDHLPVAVLDDDPHKKGRRVYGVPVLGGRDRLAEVARERRADTLLLALPSAQAVTVSELACLAQQLGLGLAVVPPLRELLAGRARTEDLRPLGPADLLGREPVRTGLDQVAGYLTGRRILVTGAGGSIGSELCRQIARFSPAQLIMLDRDESALHAVQLSIDGRGLLDDDSLVVADIRDRHRISDVLADMRPDVVFHAAALKHLPLLERHPTEAVKSNVWGTQNVLDACLAAHVRRFVNISTDKAADATSVLGLSKRLAERLTAHAAASSSLPYLSVRFGNVLGSRGSVLTAFRSQVGSGGPLTVTHPDVTRYFMTVEEAVELVIQAGSIGEPGQVLVLDMGDPVRIADVAARFAATSVPAVPIVFTGLRPGEKLHEVLLGSDELDLRPKHPKVSQVPVPPLPVEELSRLNGLRTREPLVAALAALAVLPPLLQLPERAVPHQSGASLATAGWG